MDKKKILIVEDEIKIVKLLQDYLINADFDVSHIGEGDRVINYLKKESIDLVLLDIRLPGMNGIEICKSIRTFSKVPIIMVTAEVEEIDRLLGLEVGADDYVCKPFSPREIVARVKAVFRRMTPIKNDDLINIGKDDIIMDTTRYQVKFVGSEIKFTRSEFEILKVMLLNPERVFSRANFLEKIQGDSFEGYERNIDTHIKNLRKKLVKSFSDKYMIRSVYGVGYKFEF